MKFFKVIWMLFAVVISLGGCGESASSQPKALIDGFDQYASEDSRLVIQYPSDWVLVDKNTEQSILDELGEKMNIPSSAFTQELEQYYILVYATNENGFLASVNISKLDGGRGVDNRALQDESFQSTYGAGIVTEFLNNGQIAKVVQEAQGAEFDGQYYMTIKIEHVPFNSKAKMISYQAMTIENGIVYSFNFTAQKDETVDFDALADNFEKMLGSVELK